MKRKKPVISTADFQIPKKQPTPQQPVDLSTLPIVDFTEFLENYQIDVHQFEEQTWQQSVLHAKPQLTLDNVFNFNILQAAVDKFPIFEDIDFCASTFSKEMGRVHWKAKDKTDGLGEDDDKSSEGTGFQLITVDDINKLYDQKYTIQFHQPQRFSRPLWSLLEIFERHFHSLAGANIYITPEESQGLAPHYDNVDVFIIQLEGSKAWNVWQPLKNANKLPAGDASGDFDEEDDLTADKYLKHDILLQKGDLLYFPRGFIHQARTMEKEYSCHITISLYENHSLGDFLREAVTDFMENISKDELKLRRGLPVGFRHEETSALLQQNLGLIADKLKFFRGNLEVSPIIADFYRNRLPPLNCRNEPHGQQPSAESRIGLIFPDHVLISNYDITAEDASVNLGEEEIDLGAEEIDDDFFYVFSSTKNTRAVHMMGKRQDETLDLLSELNLESFRENERDAKKANYVQKIMENMQNNTGPMKLPLKFKDACSLLQSKPKENGYSSVELGLKSDADFMQLAISLWAECLVKVVNY